MLIETCFSTGHHIINYIDTSTTGTPVVLLHDAAGWWQDWQPVMSHLSPNWHIYACDLRGHGKSDWDGENYRLTDYTADTTAFLHENICEPVILMGQGLGALIALAVAAQSPHAVQALILINPEVDPSDESLRAIYNITQSVQTYAEMLALCRESLTGTGEAEIKAAADKYYGIAPDALRLILENRLLEGFDTAAAYAHLTCPKLILPSGEGADIAHQTEAFLRSCMFAGA